MFRKRLGFILLALCVFPMFRCAFAPSQKKVQENLEAYARMYGYIRFFHPSDLSTEIHWDSFSVYAINEIMQAREPIELKSNLEKLFLPIAPSSKLYFSKEKQPPIEETADIDGKLLIVHRHQGGASLDDEESAARSYRTNRGQTTMENSATAYQMNNYPVRAGQEFRFRLKLKYSGDAHQILARMMFLANKNRYEIKLTDQEGWQEISYQDSLQEDSDRLIFIIRTNLYRPGKIDIDEIQFDLKDSLGQWQTFPMYNGNFEQNDTIPEGWRTNAAGECEIELAIDSIDKNQSLCISRETLNLYSSYAPYGETFEGALNSSIRCIFPLALISEIRGKTEEPKSPYSLIDLQTKYSNFVSADPQLVQLADFILCWNMFHHFHAQTKQASIDWDGELSAGLDYILMGCSDIEFQEYLRALFHKLDDGYLGLLYKDSHKYGGLPFTFDYLENALIITRSDDPLFKSGDRVLSINGQDAVPLLLKQESLSSGSPQRRLHKALYTLSYAPSDSSMQLLVERAGKELKLKADYELKDPLLGHFDHPSFEVIEDDIFYLNALTLSSGELQHHRKTLEAAKGIVLDLRTSSLNYNSLIEHFIEDSLSTIKYQIPCYAYPDQYSVYRDSFDWKYAPASPYISSKLVVLSDRTSAGVPEVYLHLFRKHKMAKIIGQPSGGIVGNLNKFTLPSGHQVYWNGLQTPSMSKSGVLPDILVQQTRAAYEEVRDLSLEAAVEYLKNGENN